MSSRYLLVGLFVFFCGSVRCQAKPLSFNGVVLGQKWDAFLKAHPKAEVAWPSDEESTMTKAQQLALEAKSEEGGLHEMLENSQFPDVLYSFRYGSLTQISCMTALKTGINPANRNLTTLKEPLSKLLAELGTPTAQGIVPEDVYGSCPVLVWKRPTECAFAHIYWPLSPNNPGFLGVAVSIINAPWRTTKPGFEIWPAVLAPKKDDSIRMKQLMALLETLRPGCTQDIKKLEVAPDIGLSPKKSVKP